MKPGGNVLKASLESTLAVILIVSILVMIGLFAGIAWVRFFDPDEFQHLESAWLLTIGIVPYKDYFEHHTPLYYFLISPLLKNPLLTTNGDAAVHMVLELRLLGVALSAGILAMVYLITRRLVGQIEALFAAALLAGAFVFVRRGIEIRPDQLSALLFLISTWALILAKDAKRWWWPCALAGIAAALAVLASQKILLAGPGLAVTFFTLFVQRRFPARNIIAACGIFVAGGLLAALPVLFYFYSHGAMAAFINDNFLLGGKWKHITSNIGWIFCSIGREDAVLILMAGIGLVDCLRQKRETALWRLAVIAPFPSMMLCIPVFPVVQMQYVFLFMPYVAILAGIGSGFVTRAITVPKGKLLQPALILPLVILIHETSMAGHELTTRDDVALAKLRYVVEQTSPTDTVLPTWAPGIAFRKPAFFYPILHGEARALISDETYAKFLEGLRDGSVSPAVIEMNQATEQLPPAIVDILKKGWEPTSVGTLWRRR